jgi:hypothetical protein
MLYFQKPHSTAIHIYFNCYNESAGKILTYFSLYNCITYLVSTTPEMTSTTPEITSTTPKITLSTPEMTSTPEKPIGNCQFHILQ